MNARHPPKIRASSVIAVMAAVLAGVSLFWTAQKVQMAQAQLQKLQDEAAGERQAMHVLRAEWDYLNRPDRLEALARQHLSMAPPQAGAVVNSPAALGAPEAPAPAVKAQPAVMRQPAAPLPAAMAPAKPAGPQIPESDRRSFQDLLKDLDRGKGEAR